ncbi:MAG: ABC transporter permease, partial [Chloroflexota bacterium]
MTATDPAAVDAAATPPTRRRAGVGSAARDTLVITRRNLKRFLRMPQLLVFATVQPVMFLLLFNFVFGGAMALGLGSSANYIDFLIPGILVQAVVFGATNTAIGLTEDLSGGVIDRFRS